MSELKSRGKDLPNSSLPKVARLYPLKATLASSEVKAGKAKLVTLIKNAAIIISNNDTK
ncbi:MAG: hypothetical protein ACD_32C00005G0002 [uncultured bacterium]|nr:MAG: hypothetical protein ACD_32C00005G0002 [uncultured bacterium]